jgi:hypothetical protein
MYAARRKATAIAGILNITNNTHTIHHYDGSWLPQYYKNKLEFQPPKVKIDPKLKRIREKRILMSNKDSVTTTEANNKNDL